MLKNGWMKSLLLVDQILPDPLRHRDGRALEFEDPDGDPVDVEHDVGPLGVLPRDRDLFGDREVVRGRIRPVDQVNCDRVFAESGTDLDAVAKETVDVAVGVVEGLAPAEGGGLVELVERLGDEGGGVALALEEPGEVVVFDVPVVVAFVPVAEISVAELVPKMADDAALGLSLKLANGRHRGLLRSRAGLGSGSVAESSSTFQWPPLSGPTRAIFPAVRNLSSRYRTVDLVVPRVAAISRRLADGFWRRRARMRSARGRGSGGWSFVSGGFLVVFWRFSGRSLAVFWLCLAWPPAVASTGIGLFGSLRVVTVYNHPVSSPVRPDAT